MMASLMYASAQSAPARDRYHSARGLLGGREPDPGAGPARIDRDLHLLEALRRREPTAAEQLVSTFGDRAYRLAISITGNRQDAEEAVQDTFWSVIRKIDTFRGDAALGSWIYRIAANAANHKRRSGARRRHEISVEEFLPIFHEDGCYAEPIVDWSTDLDDPAVQGELRNALTSALQELPDHYRTVIILHDVEALSMAEVADWLNITVAAAKARVHRARLFLRQRLTGFMSSATSGVKAGS
jgi:RNA polymerase sigma-70 factor (ECF subfamily)